MNNTVKTVAVLLVTMVVLAGSVIGVIAFVTWNNHHQSARGRGDASVGNVNSDPRNVYQMPDAFSNVAMFCDKYGNSVYVTTKTDSSRGVWALKDGCQ